MNFYHETEFYCSKVVRLADMLDELGKKQAPHPGAINPDIIEMVNRARHFASTGAGWAFADSAVSQMIYFYCVHADAKDYGARCRLLNRG